MLDSGAYSCWRRQEDLTVEEFVDFVIDNEQYVDTVVNLDVIPGEFGRVPSPVEVEESAKKGWDNLEFMLKEEIIPIPVFHQGERFYWLEKMLDRGFDYVGISPANDRTSNQKQEWLDEVFSFLCGDRGYPEVKTHGFGMTALPLLFRYPWFSCDSITWVLIGVYGGILVPCSTGGEYDYSKSPLVIAISSRGTKQSNGLRRDDYGALGPAATEYVDTCIAEEKFDLEELKAKYECRLHWNCRFFKNVTEGHTIQRFVPTVQGFFTKHESKFGCAENKFGKMRVIFTLNTTKQHSDILQDEGIVDRLMSYYFFKHGEPFDLKSYARTGRLIKCK